LQPKPDPRISGKQFSELLKSAQSSSKLPGQKNVLDTMRGYGDRTSGHLEEGWYHSGSHPHIKLERWPQRHTRRPSSAKLKTPHARKTTKKTAQKTSSHSERDKFPGPRAGRLSLGVRVLQRTAHRYHNWCTNLPSLHEEFAVWSCGSPGRFRRRRDNCETKSD
jgi:hypothetical protein